MKTITTALLLILPSGVCFSPQTRAALPCATPLVSPTSLRQTKKLEEIDHELQELGAEINAHVIDHAAHGFDVKESTVHKLRRELREKDRVYHDLLDEMERMERRQVGMADLKTVLEKTFLELKQQNAMLRHKKQVSQEQQDTLHDLLTTIKKLHNDMVQANVFALVWETTEVELRREKQAHDRLEKERESVRSMLWQATKLMGRRVKNFCKRIFSFGIVL